MWEYNIMKIYSFLFCFFVLALSGCAINEKTLSKPNGAAGNTDGSQSFPPEDPTETVKWQDLGGPNCSQLEDIFIAVDNNNNPYVAFNVIAKAALKVYKLNGTTWQDISPGIFANTLNTDLRIHSLLISNDTPIISYTFKNNHVYKHKILKYKGTGNDWDTLGNEMRNMDYLLLAKNSQNELYLAYTKVGEKKISIAQYQNDSWSTTLGNGIPFNDLAKITDMQLKIAPNDIPYVFFLDDKNIKVKKYQNNSWIDINSPSTSRVRKIFTDIDKNNNLYFALMPCNSSWLSIEKYNGSSWSQLNYHKLFAISDLDIVVNDTTPYMALRGRNPFSNYNEEGLLVEKYNNNQWENIRSLPFKNYHKSHPSLAISPDNKNIYLAFLEGSRPQIKKYIVD